jgi:hypothetical protein
VGLYYVSTEQMKLHLLQPLKVDMRRGLVVSSSLDISRFSLSFSPSRISSLELKTLSMQRVNQSVFLAKNR